MVQIRIEARDACDPNAACALTAIAGSAALTVRFEAH